MNPRRLLPILGCLAWTAASLADNPAGNLLIEPIVAYNLVVDSNIQTPAGRSPRSAYVGVKFCNIGTNTLTNVVAYIGDFSAGTPGIYPVMWTNKPGPGLFAFSLTHEGGSSGTADATRRLGTIEPGECVPVYWLVSYPLKDSAGNPVWGPSVKPYDDLELHYDIWATAYESGGAVTAHVPRKVTLRNEITAMANKIFPNQANKVPPEYLDLLEKYQPEWTNVYSDGTVGTRIITEGYWYDLGVVGFGFDNDNDLVPDHNAWMQPVGDPSIFDPSCFRLIKTYAMVVVKLVPSGEKVYMLEDQLYLEHVPENSGAIGLVQYLFTPLRAGCSSTLTPYQEVASGYDNEKYNADYGATLSFASGSNSIYLSKNADPVVVPGTNISYSISHTNRGQHTVGDLTLATPLVINETIPSGTYYVAGSATARNVLPPDVSEYVVLFSTNHGETWTDTEPADPRTVTDIQWWLGGDLATGVGGSVSFQVTVTNPPPLGLSRIENQACLSMGSSDPFVCTSAVTRVLGTNKLGDTVWRDDGTGGGWPANGLQETGEPGIAGITVRLYADLNTNGVFDGDDILIEETETDANGYYLFTNLVDGAYKLPGVRGGYRPHCTRLMLLQCSFRR